MTSLRTKRVLLEATSLRYFREAATAGSIRRAAESLYVSPSALTRQIAQLERLLGTQLLERKARGVTLTHTGTVLLNFSNQSLFRINELIGALDDLDHMRTGQVSIASVEGLAASLLAECIVAFQKSNSNVSISMSVLSSNSVVEAVLSGEVEIGLAFEPRRLPELRFVQEISQPLCAVMRIDHVLAKRRSLDIDDVVAHPLVLPNTSFGLRQIFDRAIADHELEVSVAVETNSIEAVKNLVKSSPGFLTIMHRSVIQPEIRRRELRAIPINDSLMTSTREVLLVRKDKFLSQAALQFMADLSRRMGTAQSKLAQK